MKLLLEVPIRRPGTTLSRRLVHLQARLLRIRAALLRQIKRLTQDASEDTPAYSIHMADAGTDSFDRDLILGLASYEQEALYEVDAALKRIENGTYGVCELTGRPIPWKRLAAVPWTRFSIAAERQLEAGAHPHLGPFRTARSLGEESFEEPVDLQVDTPSEESSEYLASQLVSQDNT